MNAKRILFLASFLACGLSHRALALPIARTPASHHQPLTATFGPALPADVASPSHVAPAPGPVASASTLTGGQTPLHLDDYQEPVAKPEPSLWLSGVSVLSKLALVLGLAYLCLGFYKRYALKRSAKAGAGVGMRGMRVVESVPLAGSQHLHLVALGDGRQIVVGSNGSQLLVKLAELVPTSEAAAPGEPATGASRAFQAELEVAQSSPDDFQGELAATLRQVLFQKGRRP